MQQDMKAYCGAYCAVCEWREKTGCKGCKANQGQLFWGECDKAKCCIEHHFSHCGECSHMPCQKLQALFQDPEHGDQGVRLRNLENWRDGRDVYERLGNASQNQAKQK